MLCWGCVARDVITRLGSPGSACGPSEAPGPLRAFFQRAGVAVPEGSGLRAPPQRERVGVGPRAVRNAGLEAGKAQVFESSLRS
jgi:hypothetical protein